MVTRASAITARDVMRREGVAARLSQTKKLCGKKISCQNSRLSWRFSFVHLLNVLAKSRQFVGGIFQTQHVLDAFEQFKLVDRFGKKIIRPRLNGAFDITNSLSAVTMRTMTLLVCGLSFILRQTSKPLSLGIITSSRMRSGWKEATLSKVSWPSTDNSISQSMDAR